MTALALLSECDGDEIWSIEHCRSVRVPEAWIEELADAFESGFQNDSQTIYVPTDSHKLAQTNQYQGIRDVDLAMKLAESLGVDAQRVTQTAINRRSVVRTIKEAVEEG
ncbi:hypothetical protein [Planctomycetes bacterium K23_9]|uniref:Uncharacterized protein n=1 Tax=Stieleria marina TaxID=1930275 RepID=A0A517P2B3_9BACT|nr:hypothetical protein K239x_55310 [Planctomycetes bacterium K23_9]